MPGIIVIPCVQDIIGLKLFQSHFSHGLEGPRYFKPGEYESCFLDYGVAEYTPPAADIIYNPDDIVVAGFHDFGESASRELPEVEFVI